MVDLPSRMAPSWGSAPHPLASLRTTSASPSSSTHTCLGRSVAPVNRDRRAWNLSRGSGTRKRLHTTETTTAASASSTTRRSSRRSRRGSAETLATRPSCRRLGEDWIRAGWICVFIVTTVGRASDTFGDVPQRCSTVCARQSGPALLASFCLASAWVEPHALHEPHANGLPCRIYRELNLA